MNMILLIGTTMNTPELMPTGFYVMKTLFSNSNEEDTTNLIPSMKAGRERDYKYARSLARTVASNLNNCQRQSFSPSEELTSELDSVEAVREFARRYGVNIKSLSVEAQKAINLGVIPKDTRRLELKQLSYDNNLENPLVLFTRRRKASLESKVAKSLERLSRYRRYAGDYDPQYQMIQSKLDDFESLSNQIGAYSLWRGYFGLANGETPSEIVDLAPRDFGAITFVINPAVFLKNDLEFTDMAGTYSRVRAVADELNKNKNGKRVCIEEKDNFLSGERDRAYSSVFENPFNNAMCESRIITPRRYIEATLGNKSHDGYKLQQRRNVEDLMRVDIYYQRIVENALGIMDCGYLEELFSK